MTLWLFYFLAWSKHFKLESYILYLQLAFIPVDIFRLFTLELMYLVNVENIPPQHRCILLSDWRETVA